jgi:transcription elongation factor Elf1
MMKCSFCGAEGEWVCVLRNPDLVKKDGSDVILCDSCMNLYANMEWDKLAERIQARIEKVKA